MPRVSKAKAPVERLAWTPREWREAVALSKSQVADMIRLKEIPSSLIGGARRITVSPAAFLARHSDVVVPPITREEIDREVAGLREYNLLHSATPGAA